MPKPAPKHSETQVVPEPALEKRSRRRFSFREEGFVFRFDGTPPLSGPVDGNTP